MKYILLTCAFALSACGALTGSDMPDMDDPQAVRAAAAKLDPIAPGSTTTDTGVYGMGQPGSDRYLFVERMKRWTDDESDRRLDIDYKPVPLPRSIAQAIQEQRTYEIEWKAGYAASHQALEREEAAADARRRAESELVAQRREGERIAIEKSTQMRAKREEQINAEFAECDRQREAAQAQQPLEDGYATYRSFACDQKRDDARVQANAEVWHLR